MEAYRAALEVRTRASLPQDWAMTQNNLGNALQEQGTRSPGEAGRALLAQAVEAYRAALEVYTRASLPQDWAMTQNNLGNALQEQGTRSPGEAGRALLAQAVEAYRAALEVYTRASLPQDWAMTQNNLGNALKEQGTRSPGEAGRALLAQAAYAYDAVLDFEPSYTDVSARLESLYHDELFVFDRAFTLNERRAALLPNDFSAQADLAEKHLTTGQFADASRRTSRLIEDTSVPDETKIALRAILFVSLLGLGEREAAVNELDALAQAVATAPADFQVGWSFAGTKQFVRTAPALEPYKDLLLQVFAALEASDRTAIRDQLQAIDTSALRVSAQR